jgi:tetratricopeptide (TPR) repeat protein
MAGFVGKRGKATARERAQDLMYEAFEADDARRLELALEALEIDPECADAYVLLAEEGAETPEEKRDLYTRGVIAGERSLGKEAFREDVGDFWGILETRPYMRARCGLARCLWALGEREAAVGHYCEMLRLNPNDNQGIRDLLINCLLELGRDADVWSLLGQYEDDASATWAYSRAIAAFRRGGDSADARKRLAEALERNPHAPALLLGKKPIPKRLPDLVGFGDRSEAVAYASDNIGVWKQTPGALEWLAAAVRDEKPKASRGSPPRSTEAG